MQETPKLTARTSHRRAALTFVRRYAEMVLVMIVGMLVLGSALGLPAAAFGATPDVLTRDAPAVLLLGMGFSMTAPMVWWMRRRGHSWAANREMAGAMIVPTIMVVVLLAAGALDDIEALLGIQHVAMLPAMFAVMLRRRAEYTRPPGRRASLSGGQSASFAQPGPELSSPPPPTPSRRRTSLLTFPSGRRAKWVVLAVGLLLVFAAGPQAGKLQDAIKQDASSYLPGDSESLAVVEAAERLPGGEQLDGLVVYERAGGLTGADRERIATDRRELNEDPPASVQPVAPPVVAEDGTVALLGLTFGVTDAADDRFISATDRVREVIGEGSAGLEVALGGPAGFAADGIEIFEQLDGALLLGTALLVMLLLIAIYRSPIFWLLPFAAILMAEIASRGLGFGLTELGVTVNGQSASILVVLVFGAGTDYALLLVARYREELRRHEDRHEAMAIALRRAGPAILASGATVIAALLCLTLAELNGTAGLGPIGAMGVALAMIASVTLLPALVLVGGRRAFWPFVPRFDGAGVGEQHGPWRRVGDRVGRAPRRSWIGTVALLAVLCAGLGWFNTDLTSADTFRGDVDSVEAQQLLEGSFPAGGSAPTEVLVRDTTRLEEVRSALADAPGVAEVGAVQSGEPGALVDVTLDQDPYSLAAFELIPELRDVAKRAGGGSTLVGGATAVEHDVRESAARDNRVIIPIVLAVVFLILAALLRALVAPLLLILTVIASYAAALGVGSFVFDTLFGFDGIDPGLPLFAFIFLVALGVDYNIFLMARAREETLRHGNREGTIRALAATGAVITSAGLVLAGTFSILGVLPIVPLTELGFIVAFGVLLDTFIVRSVLVPALVIDLGRRTWWPSSLAHTDAGTAAHAGTQSDRAVRQPA